MGPVEKLVALSQTSFVRPPQASIHECGVLPPGCLDVADLLRQARRAEQRSSTSNALHVPEAPSVEGVGVSTDSPAALVVGAAKDALRGRRDPRDRTWAAKRQWMEEWGRQAESTNATHPGSSAHMAPSPSGHLVSSVPPGSLVVGELGRGGSPAPIDYWREYESSMGVYR